MGMSYFVSFDCKLKDKDMATKVLQDMVRNPEPNVSYSLDEYAKQGIYTETFDDLMRIFLAGWKGQELRIDGTVYENEFDARYGWEDVMFDMFDALTPYLEWSSTLTIGDDYGTHFFKFDDDGNVVKEYEDYPEEED